MIICIFFFNDTATTEIYTLSLHDALPILGDPAAGDEEDQRGDDGLHAVPGDEDAVEQAAGQGHQQRRRPDRKSTRLNSSHANISYAVFCLKKKKIIINQEVCYQYVMKSFY